MTDQELKDLVASFAVDRKEIAAIQKETAEKVAAIQERTAAMEERIIATQDRTAAYTAFAILLALISWFGLSLTFKIQKNSPYLHIIALF
ncbi:MAG: hypothetical protein FWF63_03645 [Fibromonadales bacterium]|nr:hypothetical protein [Fibromonadales bacterium]